jgi:hypothetical protein
MTGALQKLATAIRTGAFMDRDRAIVGTGIFGFFCVLAVSWVFLTADGFKDFRGDALGGDFIALYAGGKVALADGGPAAYDVNRIFAEHQAITGEDAPEWGPFFYPPAFLLIAMTLASLPFTASWLFFMGVTGALYVAATLAIAKFRFSIVPVLAFSAVFMNFMQGQTGFLVAGLFAGGLVALRAKREILAGVLFGCLALKPQYGLLIPFALAAAGHWRAFAAAAFAAAAFILAPTLAFGADIWTAFAGGSRIARIEVLEKGGIGFFKIISVFSQAKLVGAPTAIAYGAQALAAIAAAAGVIFVWRRAVPFALKAATLILATFVAIPYALEYDLVLLAPAIAFLIDDAMRTGFRDYEKSALVIAFLTPGIARMATNATHVSLGLVVIVMFLAFLALRVRTVQPDGKSA